jgi:hypothetical protein
VQLLLWIFQHAAYERETGDLNCSHQWCPSQSEIQNIKPHNSTNTNQLSHLEPQLSLMNQQPNK